jgi:hypothetical protein
MDECVMQKQHEEQLTHYDVLMLQAPWALSTRCAFGTGAWRGRPHSHGKTVRCA